MSPGQRADINDIYRVGLSLMGKGIDQRSPQAIITISGMDHLYAVELFSQYSHLRKGFGLIANRTQPDCIVNYLDTQNGLPTFDQVVALSFLDKIRILGILFLKLDALRELDTFISVLRGEIKHADREMVYRGMQGTSALFELMFCPETRELIVGNYYRLRPELVAVGFLTSIEQLKLIGKAPPMYEFWRQNPTLS